ncbi:ABC-three component system middle component 1 [Formosa undariae]|uniref:ABC-three component system middle component 1 n=1 Tax=Formosa undariae TaxID=1325436 RepID=A0ABV5EYN4_9FLAO
MENYSAYSTTVLDDLSKRFENLNFKFLVHDIGVKISVFIVNGKSSDIEQKDNWRLVSEEIALKFQSKMDSKDDKWNLYIIYTFSDKVDKELKAKIENNKFSSRKIVVDSQIDKLRDELINNLIIQHITNTDLIDIVNKTDESVEKKYEPKNKSIWDLIPKTDSIIGNTKLQTNIIEQLKKAYYED